MLNSTTQARSLAMPSELDIAVGAMLIAQRAMYTLPTRVFPSIPLRRAATERRAELLAAKLESIPGEKSYLAIYPKAYLCAALWFYVGHPTCEETRGFVLRYFAAFGDAPDWLAMQVKEGGMERLAKKTGEQRLELITHLVMQAPERVLGEVMSELLRMMGLPAVSGGAK